MTEEKFEKPDSSIREFEPRLMRLEMDYSDAELLNEVRRRGLFTRVEFEDIWLERHLAQGLTVDEQIRMVISGAATELARELVRSGRQPMGMKIDTVYREFDPSREPCRRIRLALNVVTEKRR